MSNEITVRNYVSIRNGNVIHNPPQRQFLADMTGAFGPTPGAIIVSYDGTDVDLSLLTDPGWIDIYNQEPSDGVTVSWGVYDPETDRYYPVGRLDPGQGTGLFQLDDLLGREFYPATGSGTGQNTNRLRIKAKDGTSAAVVVYAFER